METVIKRVRARVRGRNLELLEDVDLPSEGEITVGIELPADETRPVRDVLQASAGAWSDEAHPELKTRDDVARFVRALRAGFERSL